jgi:hypothetical protein
VEPHASVGYSVPMSEQHPLRIAGAAREQAEPERLPIDIDGLTEAELIDLNRRIVERLRMLQQLRAHRNMLQFSVGQRVRFRANARTVEGTLTRYNRKTVTVLTDAGEHWNVAPSLLEPA